QDAVLAEGYASPVPPGSGWASLEASAALWHGAGLVDVQTREIEVCRDFDRFEDYWLTAWDSPRLRSLFTSISPEAMRRIVERVRDALGAGRGEPLVLKARANAVKGRRA
ncbi:MAG: hypothetical protein U1E86_27565, partial [Burkholderiaceae bacterium]